MTTPTAPPTVESLSARLDTWAKLHDQLASDYRETHVRLTRAENDVLRLRESIDAWSGVTSEVAHDNARVDLAVRKIEQWTQELLRWKHDSEANNLHKREAQT